MCVFNLTNVPGAFFFSGVNAGHYTSYAKHPMTKQWHYFNDETTSEQTPQNEDYSNAYILFYQRQGKENS